MSGFFGSISNDDCVNDVFYGTDYHSHLGTKRAGLAFFSPKKAFNVPFTVSKTGTSANKFENDIKNFSGNSGIGVIAILKPSPL
jgi:amidophosphoribosyltransferase